TDRLTERCGRDTEVCSEIEPRRDDDFGPRNIALDPRRAKLLQSLHLVDDLERMFLERDRIVSAKDEGDVAAGKAARLALEAHARVGDCTELRLQAALPFDARHLALLLEREKRVPAPDIDVTEGRVDPRAIIDDCRALPRNPRTLHKRP